MEPETPEDAPDDFDIEVVKKQIEAADPYAPRLTPITKDTPVPVSTEGTTQAPWLVRLMGDKNEYANPLNPKQKVCYGVVVVRSLQWPGSYTFYNQGKYMNVYVGNGQKYETQTYYPLNPPKILGEPAELQEQRMPYVPAPVVEEPVPEDEGQEVNEYG